MSKILIFKKIDTCPNLRNRKDFSKPKIISHKFGTKSLQHFGTKIWNLLPNHFKELNTLEEFKFNISKWKPHRCPCYLCRDFVSGIGYVDICN